MARMNKRYGSGIKTGRKGEDKGRREGGRDTRGRDRRRLSN